MDSILTSIKKLLGIGATQTNFDQDLIMHINSVFVILNQLGAGPTTGFSIADATDTWDDYFPTGVTEVEAVKSYMYMKVRLMFDPPSSSAAIDSMTKMISELEWRINVMVDKGVWAESETNTGG